jgi:hypothetical protein
MVKRELTGAFQHPSSRDQNIGGLLYIPVVDHVEDGKAQLY